MADFLRRSVRFFTVLFLSLLLTTFEACSLFESGGNGSDAAWWTPPPATSLASRPIKKTSRYISMKDGTQLAIDLYLPADLKDGEKLPTLFQQTRYYRSFETASPFAFLLDPIPAKIKSFVETGYAWVSLDVRGTGASFGTSKYPWSLEERQDGRSVVDWIISQPWSNGSVGATGISYDGTAADFLLSTLHPAVKAIAPQFSLFDAYTDIAFPGGIPFRWFLTNWARGNAALDSNQITQILGGIESLAVNGVSPVDGDESKVLLSKAVAEHQSNSDIAKDALGITYRDDIVSSGYSTQNLSPASVVAQLTKSNKPIYSYSGWFDGAYAHAAIKRYLSIPNFSGRLLIGPWDHGGRTFLSGQNSSAASEFDHIGELRRFFDYYLKGQQNQFSEEKPIHYFTMGENSWKSSDEWPPRETELLTYYLRPNQQMTFQAEKGDSSHPDVYPVSYDATTGEHTRWRSLYNITHEKTEYPDRAQQTERLPHFTSPPLPSDVEVTGHPEIILSIRSTATDGEIFAYLDDISPNGDVTYVTEGLLRLIHRAEQDSEESFHSPTPKRSFLRADAEQMPINEIVELHFDLLPTSYLFRKGHSLRISIAGADKDQFGLIPAKPPTYFIYHDQHHPSRVVLPVIPKPENRGRISTAKTSLEDNE